ILRLTTTTGALVAIQKMANYSQKWHDGGSIRGLGGSNSYGISVIMNKLNDLGRDIRKLKESVHAIQVGCEMFGGTHLEQNCHLREEVKSIKVIGYGEEKSSIETAKYPMRPLGSHSPLDKRTSLEETIERYLEESSKRKDSFKE
nr:hypothetical protein [Tanacetum cinerariifolium]